MALTPAEIERLERTLTRGLQTLLSRAEGTAIQPLAARLCTESVHITEVRVKIEREEPKKEETAIERYERESHALRDWLQLYNATRSYKWDDFVAVCSRKVDITQSWKSTIANAIGVGMYELRYAEEGGYARWEWLPKVNALPDWKPEPRQRSNFAAIPKAAELVRRLRHAGMSRQEIAEAINNILRDLNTPNVTAADILRSLE